MGDQLTESPFKDIDPPILMVWRIATHEQAAYNKCEYDCCRGGN